jgi:hypothetical protein
VKNFLLLFLFAFLPAAVHAEGASLDQLVAQYKSGDFSGIGEDEYAEGRMDGEDYVAVLTNHGARFLLLFRKTADRFELIAKTQDIYDSGRLANISIKNNSLFLEEWIGHHGWHARRYQFKRIKREFMMIGAEQRSSYYINCSAGDESSACGEYDEDEAFEGTSYNFLTSEALCWRENIRFDDEKREKEAVRRFNAWLQPKGGSRHKMSFRKMDLPLLEEFDSYAFDLPEACHFDHQGKLRKPARGGEARRFPPDPLASRASLGLPGRFIA